MIITINSTQKFLSELEKIASKFEWSLQEKQYKESKLVLNQIIGYKNNKEYIPLTAVVEQITGKYYAPNFFDKAAGEIYMSPQVASQIVDACDDWMDRLHGYKPKGY